MIVKRIVRRDADGEYIQHDKRRFDITWTTERRLCPAPHYPVLFQHDWDFDPDFASLYRWPFKALSAREFLGTARAPNEVAAYNEAHREEWMRAGGYTEEEIAADRAARGKET